MSTTSPAPCEFLEWDSNFFGLKIARLGGQRLTPAEWPSVEEWCLSEGIRCVYFLAAADDAETIRTAEAHGFGLVDIRVTLDLDIPEVIPDAPDVRLFEPADAPQLRDIAKVSHRDSRFYFDRSFPADRCDALYETWIERSTQGWADATLVAGRPGEACGYLTCHLNSSGAGSIGLVAVGEQQRGRGLGRQLVDASLSYFRQNGMERVSVVTQGRNIDSQRLYQRCGFRTRSQLLWFHRWFEAVAAL
jgi:dTDP-4-amino-4,6-dideoxy-D-galactose acyltransferase